MLGLIDGAEAWSLRFAVERSVGFIIVGVCGCAGLLTTDHRPPISQPPIRLLIL